MARTYILIARAGDQAFVARNAQSHKALDSIHLWSPPSANLKTGRYASVGIILMACSLSTIHESAAQVSSFAVAVRNRHRRKTQTRHTIDIGKIQRIAGIYPVWIFVSADYYAKVAATARDVGEIYRKYPTRYRPYHGVLIWMIRIDFEFVGP